MQPGHAGPWCGSGTFPQAPTRRLQEAPRDACFQPQRSWKGKAAPGRISTTFWQLLFYSTASNCRNEPNGHIFTDEHRQNETV